ncbi:MAG: DNA repair protein RecO [Candidatus Marinimicrobia bacterium]|nr:DNA repair protein RecO [Candidatus Neomarinimicrobiota bacterium]
MPTLQSSEAVVLKTIDYSDTSLIVRLFTEQFGKVTVIAKGARRSKQAPAGILRPPNHLAVWYQHKDERDIQTLTKFEFVTRYSRLSSDLAKSAAAMVTIEMLDRAIHDFDPHPILFRLVTATLRHLNLSEEDVSVMLHFYQLQLSRQLGFAPHLNTCMNCGRPLSEAALDLTTGELMCIQCRPGGALRLPPQAVDYLQDLGRIHIARLGTVHPPDQAKKEVGQFLLKYLFFHVDGMSNMKSMTFWQQVQAE